MELSLMQLYGHNVNPQALIITAVAPSLCLCTTDSGLRVYKFHKHCARITIMYLDTVTLIKDLIY